MVFCLCIKRIINKKLKNWHNIPAILIFDGRDFLQRWLLVEKAWNPMWTTYTETEVIIVKRLA